MANPGSSHDPAQSCPLILNLQTQQVQAVQKKALKLIKIHVETTYIAQYMHGLHNGDMGLQTKEKLQ